MFSNNQTTIYFFNNKKPNGKAITEQNFEKGPFCVVFALLRILHFHQLHPKHYPGNYPKNFSLAVESFKQLKKMWKEFPAEKKEDGANTEFFKLFDLIKKENWNKIEMRKKMPSYFDPYRKRRKCWKSFTYTDYFLYLLGFHIIPYNFQDLTAEKIQEVLLKYGPLYIGGNFILKTNLGKPDLKLVTTSDKNIHIVLTLNERMGNIFEIKDFGHAIVLCGIDRVTNTIFCLDSNTPLFIFQISLQTFLAQLEPPAFAYYRPCGANDQYLENIIYYKEWWSKHAFGKDSWQPENTVCHHLQQNLNLVKMLGIDRNSPESVAMLTEYLALMDQSSIKKNPSLPQATNTLVKSNNNSVAKVPTLFNKNPSNKRQEKDSANDPCQSVYKCQRRF